MTLRKLWIAVSLAGTMFGQVPEAPPIKWQAPAGSPETAKPGPKPPKQRRGKGKWIAIGAVAAGAAVSVVLIDKRLGNEGAGILR
jgi:hypothetical protein